MELKRRFKDHPLRNTLGTAKPLSYWSTKECLTYADELKIDYTDLISTKVIQKVPQEIEEKPTIISNIYNINIKIENSTHTIQLYHFNLVLEMKYFLFSKLHQPNPSHQTIKFKNTILEDTFPLKHYFGSENSIELELINYIEVYYEIISSCSVKKIFVAENIPPITLLQMICEKENLEISRQEINFEGHFIGGFSMPIHSLGIRNKSIVQIMEINLSDLFFSDLSNIESLDFISCA